MKKYIVYLGLFTACFALSYAGMHYYLNPIPKIIHYVWLGKKPMPQDVLDTLDSWKKHAPDYQIMRWDETNCPVESSPYAEKTYADKKYAFTSDFCRYHALYHHGGLYLDTDHVLTKPLDSFFIRGVPLVLTYEHNSSISASFVGMQKHHKVAKNILDYYAKPYETTQPIPEIKTKIISKLYPNFSFDGKFFKTDEMIVYPPNETMLDFGGPENFAMHRYDASSTGHKKGTYYHIYFQKFLQQHAIAIKSKGKKDYLIPARDFSVYLLSSKKMGRIKSITNSHVTVLFDDMSIHEFKRKFD